MIVKPSILNVVSIGLMAFFGVWVIDRGLRLAGWPAVTATATVVNNGEEL